MLLLEHSNLQAQERVGELVVGRCGYCCLAYGLADYIRYLGAWDVHPLEGNPNVANNYSSLIVPFDYVTWAFVLASILATYVTFVLMDNVAKTWDPSLDTQSSM